MKTTSNSLNEVILSSPTKTIISTARAHLIHTIRKLNLFSSNPLWSPSLTENEQILSTRIFIGLISISLLIVISYASLSIRTRTITLNKFSISDFEQLEALYPDTIKAPCTEVAVRYDKFLRVSAKFHQICSSSFIRKKWISSLFLYNATSHNILDFRTFAFSHYRSLGLLCQLARQAVNDAYDSFYSNRLINRYSFSRTQFDEVSSVATINFYRNIITNEKRIVSILSMFTSKNQLISALRTNTYMVSKPGSKIFISYDRIYRELNGTEENVCECTLRDNQCVYPAGAFYNVTLSNLEKEVENDPSPQFQIPGLMAGCLPLEAIRQSTLECLYNQSCIDVLSLQPKLSRPRALNISLTRFPLNLTIGSLFDNYLFIESWENRSSFENYFAACAPRYLSYSYESQFYLGTIITMILNAFGGLVIALQLITPALVKIFKLIKWKKQRTEQTTTVERRHVQIELTNKLLKRRKQAVVGHIHRTARTFNLFPPKNKNDPDGERIGIIATRLYIFLTIIGLITLGIYTSLLKRNKTYTIDRPSSTQFEKLYSMHSSTLVCSCSHLSMSYGRIMSLSPRFHSICSSEYLKDDWLSYFGRGSIPNYTYEILLIDFRASGEWIFQMLSVLCKISRETIDDAIRIFRSNRFVTMNTLSRSQFTMETRIRMEQFEQNSIVSLFSLIRLIRSSIRTNQLIDNMWMNTRALSIYDNTTSKWSIRFQPSNLHKNSCTCTLSRECTSPIGFYLRTDTYHSEPNVTVPGLVLGCYSMDSILLSTLECFYDKKCIQILLDKYDFDIVGLVSPFNKRASQIRPLQKKNSRFLPNATIREIFSNLFVEDWMHSSNYTAYYERCAPAHCTYTVNRRFDTTYMIAIMLGFHGGFSTILEIILPLLVMIFLRKWSKRKKETKKNKLNKVTTDTTIDVANSASKKPSNCCCKIFNRLLSLNFFESDSPSIEKKFQHQEIIATRIYIFLFILCLIAVLIYSGPFSEETRSIKISYPTMDIVEKLYHKNISSLSCPCSNAAVPYSTFLTIIPHYHSICSSEYISLPHRIDLLKKNENISLALSNHYRLIASFCRLSRRFVDYAFQMFVTRELVSVETLTLSSFDNQIKPSIPAFIRENSNYYRRVVSFIVRSFSVNQLLHIFTTNWQLSFSDENELYRIKTFPRHFPSSNCSCATSYDCSEQLTNDIVMGCFPYDGFRLSKFRNVSLGKLSDRFFVETWENYTNYTNYFQACRTSECHYTLPDKNNPIVMLTTLLGVYGGK
ncbi:unnamed protein product [Rotaria sp. Silwood1]|nr:unnamed protein product [Rotaria sp. Silwood1]CAF4863646.1 unnamed protein product [Rotaria sp. Silwood1]